jgi:hypothetical protein
MSFTGEEDHSISLENAAELTSKYRQVAGPGAILGGYFSKNAIKAIIEQDDCVGMRFYYGRASDGKPKLVLVGVLVNEDDMTGGVILEHATDCPPHCGKADELNS